MSDAVPLLFTDVYKTLGGREVLSGVTFRVQAGQIVGLLGPNGSGKTTCVTVAAGLRRCDSGNATVFGVPSRDREARLLSAIVPQEMSFPPTVHVNELLTFIRAQRRPSTEPPSFSAVVNDLGLGLMMGKPVGSLSGGQRRKLAIALAFVCAPRLLIFDEATSNLDVETREAVWSLCATYIGGGGAMLVTSHILPDIEDNADSVVVLNAGRLIRTGTVAEIRTTLRRSTVTITLSPENVDFILSEIRSHALGDLLTVTGTTVRISTTEPENTVRVLLASDAAASNLSVVPPDLAEALTALTSETEGASRQ